LLNDTHQLTFGRIGTTVIAYSYLTADHFINELSDGERQRAMIAKALVQDTPVILLDEPTAHLDINNRVEVMTWSLKVLLVDFLVAFGIPIQPSPIAKEELSCLE
jgi:ABC-type enterochelin transport system ATPase subunit